MVRTLLLNIFILIIISSSIYAQDWFDGPESMAFDSVSDCYFVSNYYDGSIVQINRYGQHSYFKTGLFHCYGNCIKDNILYVSVPGRVVGYDLTSGDSVFAVNIATIINLDGLTTDTSGYLYALDTGGRLHKIDIEEQSSRFWLTAAFRLIPRILSLTSGIT